MDYALSDITLGVIELRVSKRWKNQMESIGSYRVCAYCMLLCTLVIVTYLYIYQIESPLMGNSPYSDTERVFSLTCGFELYFFMKQEENVFVYLNLCGKIEVLIDCPTIQFILKTISLFSYI